MSKKKKTKAKAKTKATGGKARRRRKRWLAPAIAALFVLAAAGYFFFARQPSPARLQATAANCPVEGMRRAEMRATLPPKLFVGQVRSAYAVARAIPAVLDQLYCYCRCKESIGHKSLLSCYTDTHGANCGICIAQAEMAAQMTDKGACPAEIQQAMDRRFDRR